MLEYFNAFFTVQIVLYFTALFTGAVFTYIIYILFKERLLKSNLANRKAYKILIAAIILYIIFFSVFSVVRYEMMLPNVYDMGNMEQTLWNTANGDYYRMTTTDPATSRLHYHVEPVFLTLAPFYNIWPNGNWLLILQTIILALGAWPVFLIAKRVISNRTAALMLAISYLLFPAIHQANSVDFHPLALGSTFILFAFYWFLEQRYSYSFIFFSIAMMCREEYALMVGMFGLYFVVARRLWRFGFGLIIMGFGWFLFVLLLIMPTFSPADSVMQWDLYLHLGSGPQEIITNIFTQPGNAADSLLNSGHLSYVLYLLAPVCLLPIFGIQILAVGVFSFFSLFLRSETSILAGLMHNHSSLVAPIFIALVFGLYFIARKYSRKKKISPDVTSKYLALQVLVVSVVTLLILQFTVLGFWQYLDPVYTENQRAVIKKVRQIVPEESSVMAPSVLGERFANRKDLYTLNNNFEYEKIAPDYIFITTNMEAYCRRWNIKNATETEECRQKAVLINSFIERLQEDKDYYKVLEEDEMHLFENINK